MQQERVRRLITYSGVGLLGIALVGIGGFFVYKKKKTKQSLEINSAFPNPFVSELMVHYSIPAGAISPELVLRNGNGEVVISTPLLFGAKQSGIGTSKLRNGIYFLQIISGNHASEIIKVVKR
jgi:LPXTG-motif cell wall-anchored protein